ncbi:MAG: DUF3536 domain-containing protein [Elusimicrobiota bacterium]
MTKYACIHGHFYQPPRENPWTGLIERQPSAGEDHDWNARIARECYAPNSRARVIDPQGNERNINNYAFMSFNFGPTLLSWLEKNDAETYAAILRGDRESAARLAGHGNAIAQAYNHMILPLASRRDQETQILWGRMDFESRFGRSPEALWIPECAANDETLELLAAHGFKYAILGVEQAAEFKPLFQESPWRPADGADFDCRRSYLWRSEDSMRDLSISIFFYHAELSRELAFSNLMADSPRAAERFNAVLESDPPVDPVLSVASDGETYGHHQKFSEMGLAHLLTESLPAKGVAPINYGWHLSRFAPQSQVRIKKGKLGLGTSWSCPHGVMRWFEDCGCGSNGKPMAWKKPLREALDCVREKLAGLFENEGGRLLKDPWLARNEYVSLILDPGRDNWRAFLIKHLKNGGQSGDQIRRSVAELLEMQKYALFMYTSCGWFFPEISGLEASQNIKYAARAIEIARKYGAVKLENEFMAALKKIYPREATNAS